MARRFGAPIVAALMLSGVARASASDAEDAEQGAPRVRGMSPALAAAIGDPND